LPFIGMQRNLYTS